MNEIMKQLNEIDGRDWLAMQLVLGELTDEQAAEFDEVMLNDPALCESVVTATRLASGIVRARESSSVIIPATTLRRSVIARSGVFVAGAALLGLLVTLANLQFSTPPRAVSQFSANLLDDADALARLLPDELPSPADIESSDEPFLSDSLADLMAPEWLITAVDLEQAAATQVDPDDSEVY